MYIKNFNFNLWLKRSSIPCSRASCRSQYFCKLASQLTKIIAPVIRKYSQRIYSPLRVLSFASLTFASNLLKNEFVKYRNCSRLSGELKSSRFFQIHFVHQEKLLRFSNSRTVSNELTLSANKKGSPKGAFFIGGANDPISQLFSVF